MIESDLKRIYDVVGIGGGAAAIPMLAAFADLQPPWPPAIAYVSAAMILMAALAAIEWGRNSKQVFRRRLIIGSAVATLIGLFAYLTLYSLFVENVPGADVRVIKGYECTSEAALIFSDRCPDLGGKELRGAAWHAENLWTRESITFIRIGLTACWLLFTAGLIGMVGSVVAGRRAAAKKNQAAG
jgi:uncharacterized membrane protein YfcA